MSRSFEKINYLLRPNKNVERKLIVSGLRQLSKKFDVANYRYVGFGSMWFVDFVLMHRVVGMSDLVTIEKVRPKRVEFNKPFGCIDVQIGPASERLGVVLGDKRSVVWLDYDGPLEAALSGDLETATPKLPSGSIIIVTVNASVEQLNGKKRDDQQLSPIDYLVDITGREDVRAEEKRLTRNEFPQLVANLLHDRLKAAVLSYLPEHEYKPIWTFKYQDDAIMVTVGGMVVNATDKELLDQCVMGDLAYNSSALLFEIDLPVLTEREKRALDRLLPSAIAIDPKALDFELRPTEIEAYRRFYIEYPVFIELAA